MPLLSGEKVSSDKAVPSDCELMSKMSPADRLIFNLRIVEQSRELPIEHFRELSQTVYRLAAMDFHRAASLGVVQIAHGQDSIVRNLMETVIGETPFTLFDIGASDGWFLDRVAHFDSAKSIVAFEPIPAMLAQLNERKVRWPKITIVPHAVGAEAGQCLLNVYNRVSGLSSLLEFEDDYHFLGSWFDANDRQQIEVEVITLDDYLSANPASAPTENIAMKVDVQGFEEAVLKGATQLLESGRVKAILIELVTRQKYRSSITLLPALQYLDSLGFTLYDTHPFYRERDMAFQECHTGQLTELDCLLVHKNYLNSL